MVNAHQQQIEKSIQHLEQLKLVHEQKQNKLGGKANWPVILGVGGAIAILGVVGLFAGRFLLKTKRR